MSGLHASTVVMYVLPVAFVLGCLTLIWLVNKTGKGDS